MAEAQNHGKMLSSWTFPEFVKHRRSYAWYITAALVLTGLVIFGIATQNYLFIVLIVLFIAVYLIRARRDPNMLQVSITEDGVAVGEKTFYPWSEMKNFWIIYEPPAVKNLYFDFSVALRPSIMISLENQNPLEIRKQLLKYIREDVSKENESFSDGLSRILKL